MQDISQGRKLKDTLYGGVFIGSASINDQTVTIVIKSYSKTLVESRMSKEGHPVFEDAMNELRLHVLLSRIPHPHIVRLMDLRADATHLHAILEFCDTGELFPLVAQPGFTPAHARYYFKQMLLGLHFIHSFNICHRDISLENLLLHKGVLKIVDFGVAKVARKGEPIQEEDGPIGKRLYWAPEVFARVPHCGHAADMWSAGIILFVMLAGLFPYELCTMADDRYIRLCSGKSGIISLLQSWNRPIFDDLALDMLARIFRPPHERIGVVEALQHPYLAAITTQEETDGSIAHAWQLKAQMEGQGQLNVSQLCPGLCDERRQEGQQEGMLS